MKYIDQDTRDEIQQAKDEGMTNEQIAGQIGMAVEDLCQLMG